MTTTITDPKERTAATLGALMFFLPHFMNKKTEFVTFYMRQNFAIWILYVIANILMRICVAIAFGNAQTIANATATRSGGILVGLFNLLTIAVTLSMLALTVMGIYLMFKAYNGERYEFKFLTKVADAIISKVDFLKSFFAPKN